MLSARSSEPEVFFCSDMDQLQNLFGVSGKVVVVTGGGQGIGYMITQAFVKAGATVYIASRKKDVCVSHPIWFEKVVEKAAKELTAEGPGRCVAYGIDVSTVAGCKQLVEEVGKHEQKVHVLVNNAGVAWGEPLERFSEVGWDKVNSFHFFSAENCELWLSSGAWT